LHSADEALPDESAIRSVWNELMANPRHTLFGGYVDGELVSSCALTVIPNLTRGCRPYGGYNVQTAVDDTHHLILAHEVTNVGNDRSQLTNMAGQARAATGIKDLTVVADRGCFKCEEVLQCHEVGITVFVPKPLTSGKNADGYEAMQQQLDQKPDMMRIRRQTVEHPFGTLKFWMGAAHFLMKTREHVSTEMSLHVLAYNLSASWRSSALGR
jgi:Transposase DDE domain